VFQQDSAPAHCARETIELLRRETPDFILPKQWPPSDRTVQILTRWITKSGLQCSSASTRQKFEMLANCVSVCWTFGAALNKMSSRGVYPPKTSGAIPPNMGSWGTEVPQRGPPQCGFGGKAPRSQKIRDLWRKQFVRIFGLFSWQQMHKYVSCYCLTFPPKCEIFFPPRFWRWRSCAIRV